MSLYRENLQKSRFSWLFCDYSIRIPGFSNIFLSKIHFFKEISPTAQVSFLLRLLNTSSSSVPPILLKVGLHKSLQVIFSTQKQLKTCQNPNFLAYFVKNLAKMDLIDTSELPLISPFFSHIEGNNSIHEILTFSHNESMDLGLSPNFNMANEENDVFGGFSSRNKPKIQIKPFKIKDFVLSNGVTPANSHRSKILIKISSNASFQRSLHEFSKYSPFSLESSLDLKGTGEGKLKAPPRDNNAMGDRSYVIAERWLSGRNSF